MVVEAMEDQLEEVEVTEAYRAPDMRKSRLQGTTMVMAVTENLKHTTRDRKGHRLETGTE